MPRNKHHYHSPWSKLSSRVQQAANTASAHVRDLYAHTATKTSAAWDSVSNHAHKATQEATYAASKAAAAAADKLSVSSASSAVKSINSTVHNAASIMLLVRLPTLPLVPQLLPVTLRLQR